MECSGGRRIQTIITAIVRPRHRPDRYGRYVFLLHFFLFILPILRECTRGTMCERVINNQEFLSCFFLPLKSDS